METIETSSLPHRSRVRFMGDWTENAAAGVYSIFGGSFASRETKDLKAFDYKQGGEMSSAGYGSLSRATNKHTTLETARELPSGTGRIHALALMFDGFLLKPVGVNTYDAAVDDHDGKQTTVLDAFTNAGSLREVAMHQICAAYSPYIWIDGTTFELPNMQLLSPGGGGIASPVKGARIQGPVLWIPEGISLTSANKFYVGFRLDRDLKGHKVDPTGSGAVEEPTVTIRAKLGYAAGAYPAVVAAGTVLWNLDCDVLAYGEFDRIKAG